MGLAEEDITSPDIGLPIGVERGPDRCAERNHRVISLQDLLKNKRAAARPQDLVDVAVRERLARLKG